MRLKSGRSATSGLRGVLSTRQGTLALALLSALIAVVVIVFALSSYRRNVNTTAQQVTVLTATGLIHKGESGNLIAAGQLYKAMPALASQIPANVVTNGSYLQGKVAASDILPGQQLTTADFTVDSGIATQLTPNERVVSVSLDASHGLTGQVHAGDHVDLYGSFDLKGTPLITMMVANSVVLQAAGTTPGASPNTVLVITSADAPKVAYASDWGKLWLVLRPPIASPPVQGITTLDSILFGNHASLKPTTAAVTGATG